MKGIRLRFKLKPFSPKQLKLLSWWADTSPVKDKEGIIADGAIRSGKSVAMGISFVKWAMTHFNDQQFAMCGKTRGAFRRNVWLWLKPILQLQGYKIIEKRSESLAIISKGNVENQFFFFSGCDESSQDDIQGMTLAGVFFDEVALMPESFVSQATARCSVDGSKWWFNCNPQHPSHYFKKDYIDKRKEKKLLYVHFLMDDNTSLGQKIIDRYKNSFFGVFFKRYILGLWVVAEGAIYDMFDDDNIYDHQLDYEFTDYSRVISIDYGTSNPMVFLDTYDEGKEIWVNDEYYYDSKVRQRQKTDEEYADDLDDFVASKGSRQRPRFVIVDPSASSFKLVLKNRGYTVKDADNSVNDGIRNVSTLFGRKLLKIAKWCYNTIEEHQGYAWQKGKDGKEAPVKFKDHTCDALRYRVHTLWNKWRIE